LDDINPIIQCHDCEGQFTYHHCLALRCTLDNEDVVQYYCKDCFGRMAKWLIAIIERDVIPAPTDRDFRVVVTKNREPYERK